MALRTFIRLLALALATMPLSLLLWSVAGPLPMLVGLGLVGLALAYLVMLAGGGDLTRWQLRYHLNAGDALDRLEDLLRFLAAKTGHLVIEASAGGLILELPAALDCYVEAQLPKALSQLKLTRDETGSGRTARGSSFLCTGAPSSDALRWATEAAGRRVRLHIHQGPHATLVALTNGTRPPGSWFRLPLPHLLSRLWHRLPLWDELSAGTRLSSLFPPAGEGAVYSSHSRLLQLIPPADYTPDPTGRILGRCADGRVLALGQNIPLFTVGAPSSFLVRQAVGDLEMGRTVVVVSASRRVLEQIGRQAGDVPVYWLDAQYGGRSGHLAVVSAAEWATTKTETAVRATQTFLADLGIDVGLPAIGDFTGRLLHALAELARNTGRDLSFADLHAVSQSTQALRAFLVKTQTLPGEPGRELLSGLDDNAGYVQAVTILSAIRTALKPLGGGPLQAFCQKPFFNAGLAFREGGLLLVPMTNADFPEHDHLLGAMLDLTLHRVLATGEDVRIAMHLHDPHLYRHDEGRRWIDVAQQDARVWVLLDTRQPDAYRVGERHEGEILFYSSEALAATLVEAWSLPAQVSDLTELPSGTALARLPGMVVTLKVDGA